jgi:DNA repair protein RecN (Recombination protein N)
VLHELRVENLLLMERAELRLAPGLNVLTGETGAGKTLLAHALDLLLGGKARSGIVREGAAEAYVEGVFALPPGLEPGVDERIPEDVEDLVLARRVWPDGRTRAYVCGRSATLADLRELGSRMLAFYGQHEHRKLMVATAQLEILDAFCGPAQLSRRAGVAAAYEQARALRERVQELRALAGARDRELDLVGFELREIEEVDPSEAEQEELTAERERLRHLETLRDAAAGGAEVLTPEEGEGVAALLAQAAGALEAAAAVDATLRPASERLQALRYEAEDIGGELRGYLMGIDAAPGRLDEVEERLALFSRLERKHGGTIGEVLRHAERCRARRVELERADSALEESEAALADAEAELAGQAGALSEARRRAGPKLAKAVKARLAELAMGEAQFEVEVSPRADGCGPRGADAVELRIASGPGLTAGPLRDVASGGELSRVMLALLSVAHGIPASDTAKHTGAAKQLPRQAEGLLVFDEIDAGIGGHTARAVGEHLRKLAEGRQVLCITHLPQVAALGNRHFAIEKSVRAKLATTTVTAIDGDDVVGELVRMLGADAGDRTASEHARDLLRAA